MKNRPMYWILCNRKPIPVKDMRVWGSFFENSKKRRVAIDTIEQPEHDAVTVSTVFIGIDHNHSSIGPPLLFESLVFGGPLDGRMLRYATWDAATKGHALLVEEAALEGKVSAWELRERLKRVATGSKEPN